MRLKAHDYDKGEQEKHSERFYKLTMTSLLKIVIIIENKETFMNDFKQNLYDVKFFEKF